MKPDEIVNALRRESCEEEYQTGLMREAADLIETLKDEYDRLRNELCNRCGRYKEAHNGACDGCRWQRKGE